MFALKVWTLKSRVILTNPYPRQCVNDSLSPLRLIARLISVFDAQNECPTETFSEGPVVQRGTGASNMEKTRGRWGKTKTR